MGKTNHRLIDNIMSSSKDEFLQNEERLQRKHKNRFSEMVNDDEDINNFKMFSEDEEDVLDDETLSKYLKKE